MSTAPSSAKTNVVYFLAGLVEIRRRILAKKQEGSYKGEGGGRCTAVSLYFCIG